MLILFLTCEKVLTGFSQKAPFRHFFKGVVRSKIGFFKNWICESRWPGRDIAFYPNKIGQKNIKNHSMDFGLDMIKDLNSEPCEINLQV